MRDAEQLGFVSGVWGWVDAGAGASVIEIIESFRQYSYHVDSLLWGRCPSNQCAYLFSEGDFSRFF